MVGANDGRTMPGGVVSAGTGGGDGTGINSTVGVAPGAPGVPVVNSTCGTVMVEVRVEVRVSLTVTT